MKSLASIIVELPECGSYPPYVTERNRISIRDILDYLVIKEGEDAREKKEQAKETVDKSGYNRGSIQKGSTKVTFEISQTGG